jgi:stress responsive alpha/beta barrel protein
MIKHIVLWKLKEDVDGKPKPETAQELKAALEGLKNKIKEIQSLEVGLNINRADTASDVSLYTEFKSREDLDKYQKHPEHLKVVELVKRVTVERRVSDYEI